MFAVAVCCLTGAAQQTVEVVRQKNQIDISIGGKSFTTYYVNDEVAKPYLMPLRSAQGTIVTRGYPVGNEVPPGAEHDRSFEPHQRPLYFTHGNIDALDFWGEARRPSCCGVDIAFARWSNLALSRALCRDANWFTATRSGLRRTPRTSRPPTPSPTWSVWRTPARARPTSFASST